MRINVRRARRPTMADGNRKMIKKAKAEGKKDEPQTEWIVPK